jgi:hypothetical protein
MRTQQGEGLRDRFQHRRRMGLRHRRRMGLRHRRRMGLRHRRRTGLRHRLQHRRRQRAWNRFQHRREAETGQELVPTPAAQRGPEPVPIPTILRVDHWGMKGLRNRSHRDTDISPLRQWTPGAPLSGSYGKSPDAGLTRDPRPPPPMTSATSPGERVTMLVPIGGRLVHGSADLLPRLEPPTLQGQRTQDLPPRLDQVQEVCGRRARGRPSSPGRTRSLKRWSQV